SGGMGGDLSFICGENARIQPVTFTGPNFVPSVRPHALVEAYEAAFDQTIAQLPVMQHGAFLDLTYKFNMAPGTDGVRMWIYSGDRQPDRRALFAEDFGPGDAYAACPHFSAAPLAAAGWTAVNGTTTTQTQGIGPRPLTCTKNLQGGEVVTDLPGMDDVGVFLSTQHPGASVGFTGDMPDWTSARLNLTPYMDHRIWILFEVMTRRDDRGLDIFNDTSQFPRQKDFGFHLSRVYVEGDGHFRNFRLKDVAATYAYQVPTNEFGDAVTTRTTTPPGNAPVVAWVHNAGDYIENGTLTLTVRGRPDQPGSTFGDVLGTYSTRVSLRPDEVKTVSVPWGLLLSASHPTLQERWLYEVRASLRSIERNTTSLPEHVDSVDIENPRTSDLPILDPNETRVRPANAASLPGLNAGVIDVTQNVRAATLRNVTLARHDGLPGNALLLCSELIDGKRCREHYAGRKGEPRVVTVGVRNDGNVPQDITVDLTVLLEGASKPDTIVGGARRLAREVLPGEVRLVSWTVVATQPGAYDLVAAAIREGETAAIDAAAQRKLYVQRSTGLICLDTIEERECGSSFTGVIVPQLRFEHTTAGALRDDGTLFVATESREVEDGVHSGQLAARDPDGAWRILANLSATRLNDTFATPPITGYGYGSIRAIVPAANGDVYLLGDNSTVLRYEPTGVLRRLEVNSTDPLHVTSALWYKGVLLAAGSNGTLAVLANDSFGPFRVSSTRYVTNNGTTTATTAVYDGTIRAMVVAANGQAVLGGQGGVVLRHSGDSVTTGWTEARAAVGNRIFSDAVGNRTVRALAVVDGRVWAAGNGFIYASAANGSSSFVSLTVPAGVPTGAQQRFIGVAQAADGRVYVLDDRNNLATCDRCYQTLATWTYVLPARPSVVGKGAVYVANATHLVGGASTHLLGEAGMVLDLIDEGIYNNILDWTTIPSLVPRDGGVLQTRGNAAGGQTPYEPYNTSRNQAILLVPDESGRAAAQQASKLRVLLNHSLNRTDDGRLPPPNANPTIDGVDDAFVELRAVYRNYPAIPI
ncbi:MAG TPA: hypothetical protein VM582_08100, partial [Candidatus Thermoplasmatota archaeon]|nr:hypothetical protein [Candidatus Thermoplasmatota archaeon]